MQTFQEIIHELLGFWMRQGCVIQQPYDVEVGAGTMHPETFFRVLGPKPYSVAYVQPSRRPADGRYAENPNRLYRHTQLQVILKPSPPDVQDIYLRSLQAIGIPLEKNDLRFEEDNWESPTLGAWGIGWQVLLNGLEITQFTYFQQAGGLDLDPISAEITYGLERISAFLTERNSVYDLQWSPRVTTNRACGVRVSHRRLRRPSDRRFHLRRGSRATPAHRGWQAPHARSRFRSPRRTAACAASGRSSRT